MTRGGDEKAGFELGVEPGPLMTIRVWGAWELPLVKAYAAAMQPILESFQGQPFGALSDGRAAPIQNEAVAAVRRDLMAQATRMGMTRVAFVASSTLSKMQLRHLARDGGALESETFTDPAAARAWLAQPR